MIKAIASRPPHGLVDVLLRPKGEFPDRPEQVVCGLGDRQSARQPVDLPPEVQSAPRWVAAGTLERWSFAKREHP